MIEYEMLYIVHARKNVEEATAVVEWVNEQITSSNGEVLSDDNWGRRRLAYPIDHEAEGTYVLVTMKLPPEATSELESKLVISEDIVRHMLIKGIIPFDGPEEQRLERPAALPPLPAPAPAPIAAPDDGGAGGPVEGEATTDETEAETDSEAAPATEQSTSDDAATAAEPEAATAAVSTADDADEAASPTTTEAE